MRILCALLLAGVVLGARGEVANRIAAVVSDSIITSQQLERFISQAELAVRDQYGSQPDAYQRKMADLTHNGLEELIERQLILHDFANLQGKVPESIIDEIVDERIRNRYSDRVQFTKMLQQEGLTLEQFRKQIRDSLIIEDMRRQFVPEPIVSPHKIELYYTNHLDKYKVEDQVKTRMIVLNQREFDDPGAAKKRAGEILLQIRGGAAFEEMARIYSEGTQKAEGGELGWRELSKMNQALVGPVSKLKPGECSDVIETPDACFLMLLEERRPAHYTALAEVREEIEKILMGEESERLQKKWIERLKKKTFVEYF